MRNKGQLNKSHYGFGVDKRKSKRFLPGLAVFSPAYFSLVMATGIVSIAAHLNNWHFLSQFLFWLNLLAYFILCILYAARLFLYTKEFQSDLFDDRRNMGFLSFPAANCLIGTQWVMLFRNDQLASFFFGIGLFSWLILLYSIFAVLIEKRQKPSLKAINGTWLLIIVSTQSLSILSGLLAPYFAAIQEQVLFFSLVLFLCGCMLYIIVITLILHRLIFFALKPGELGTPYWINMGADAISVLAGTSLILNAGKWSLLSELLPFLKGFTLLYWAIGTWWIPLMILLGAWRHLVKRVSLTYQEQFWGMVFPLGMYSVCTLDLSQVLGIPFLTGISFVFALIAILVWVMVFMSMLYFLGLWIKKYAFLLV